MGEPIDEMSRAVSSLALEVPATVWEDVHRRWQAVVDHVDHLRHNAAETIMWALDVLALYDDFLVRMGEPEHRVRSTDHMAGIYRARRVLDALTAEPEQRCHHGYGVSEFCAQCRDDESLPDEEGARDG